MTRPIIVFRVVDRWLRPLWWQAKGWLACRRCVFAKYSVDSEHPVRYTERVLRRNIWRSIREFQKGETRVTREEHPGQSQFAE
jgi:hypothetical protein